jgi:hypothetical protein
MILLLALLIMAAIFAYGYYLMGKLDHFHENTHKTIERDTIDDPSEVMDPSCVMLPEDLPEEEIAHEIDYFRKNHQNVQIILYSCQKAAFSKKNLLMTKHTHG